MLNESGQHNVPKGSETHFRVVIVSSSFHRLDTLQVGLVLVVVVVSVPSTSFFSLTTTHTHTQRHRLVNKVLREDFSSIHALSIEAYTPEQWSDMNEHSHLSSPRCLGGSKR